MQNITSKVSREDMDNARLDRDSMTNPPNSEPGMDDFGWGDAFGAESDNKTSPASGWGASAGGSPFGSSPFGSSPFGSSPFGSSPFGSSPFGVNNTPQKPEDNIEDKFWDSMKKFVIGAVSFFGEFVRSFKDFDTTRKMGFGKSVIITSVIIAILGVIFILFGANVGVQLLVGALVSLGIGTPVFMFGYDNYKQDSGVPQELESTFIEEVQPFSGFEAFEEADETDTTFNMWGDEEDEDEDETSDFYISETNTDTIDFNAFNDTPDMSTEEVKYSMDTVLDSINVDRGMVTRQYLFENINTCLVNVNKTFDSIKNITEGSAEFDAWDVIVRNSAEVMKTGNQEDMPYLISAKEKLFYIILEIKRVKWIKNIQTFVEEIVNICRFDSETGKMDANIYGIGSTVGDKIFVKIMKGETAMVTIKDAFKNVATDLLDTNNYMPIVLGVDPEGNVVWKDFKNINSILITGMPRSGKSWFVQSILTQMTFFLKPSELNFYILDPKDQISDFRAMTMPHIRKFVSTDEAIVKELRNIVKVEGPRRKKIIGDKGFVNIWDFKKKNPDVELPLLYVIIDEVVSLAEHMDKDTKNEFQGLLFELVSQLPALGIRIFMIPHIVKDQILKKAMTDIIPCRISVRGDTSHIESSVGVKGFQHKLTHQGDMAVRLNNDEPLFVHSAILTPTNEGNNDLFNFLTKFWLKIEPESMLGSVYETATSKKNYDNFITGGNISDSTTLKEGKKVNIIVDNKSKLSTTDMNDLLNGIHGQQGGDINLWDD